MKLQLAAWAVFRQRREKRGEQSHRRNPNFES